MFYVAIKFSLKTLMKLETTWGMKERLESREGRGEEKRPPISTNLISCCTLLIYLWEQSI